MNTVYIVLKILAIGFAMYTIMSELYRNKKNLHFIWDVWKRFRFGMFFQICVLISAVIASSVFLISYVPFLHYGWLNLILESGGNIITAPVLSLSASEYLWLRIVPPIFFLILFISVPFLAHEEEKIFRKGCHTWKKMSIRSIVFGLFHLIVGIPLGVSFSLIIPGMFFAHKYACAYKKLLPEKGKEKATEEAVLVSTAYHTMMNSILIAYLILVTILCV